MDRLPLEREKVLIDTIRKLIRRSAWPNLQRIVSKSRPQDVASLFHSLAQWEGLALFNTCLKYDDEFAAEVLTEVEPHYIPLLVQEMSPEQLTDLLLFLPSDDRVDLIEELPEALAEQVVKRLESEGSEEVQDLLNYDPDTAGGLMVTDYFALDEDTTAGTAIERIQSSGDAEMVFYLYCINELEQLTGVVSLRTLLSVPANTPLADIMIGEVIRVPTTMDQEEVARQVSRYNLLAVPVVDDYNKLVGIVTVDDVIDVLRDEATEDILKMAGAAEDDIVSRSVIRSVSARLPWLAASFVGGLAASELIGRYEETLKTVGVLAGFIPVIMGMGGNVGTQASTLVVRGLATGKIDPRNVAWYLAKEIRVGLLMGLFYGFSLGIFAYIRYGEGWALGATVGMSICLAMLTSATWGSFVPMVLSRLNVDPAVATGPFVTTSLDIMAILIYFNLATTLLDIG